MGGKAILDGKSQDVQACSVAPDVRFFRDRLIAGRMLAPGDGRVALVHEYLLYRWGLVSDADAESAVGRRFRMEVQTNPLDTFGLTWLLRRGGREVSDHEESRRWIRP